jgi:transcriptional regulator with XRE-family HTH domain/quercetin dioxygenase-like cupin family protein
MKEIGKRIRAERLKRQLTLEQLSQKTDLSTSFLSQIERGIGQASINSLKKIANHFGISVVQFFGDEEDNQPQNDDSQSFQQRSQDSINYVQDVRLVRAEKRKGFTLPGSNVRYELITPDLNRQLEVFSMRISEGESSGDEPLASLPGEKFGLVLKGTIEIILEDKAYQLKVGDSIYFPADSPHFWRGIEGDPIEVLWVMTPPSF